MTTELPTLRRCRLTVESDIATFRMCDPGSRNAFTAELKDDYLDLLGWIRATPTLRVLVIAGSDGAFCAGGDLKSLRATRAADGSPIRDVEGIRVRMRNTHQWFEQLYNLELPVIAAVDGPAFGAGFSLALAADFIVASPRAKFCMAFNRIGALPDLAALYMLPRMIGLRRAKQILMSAREVSCDEAMALGLLESIHPSDELMPAALRLAATLAQGSPQALALTKVCANQSLESDYATMARLEGAGQAMCLNSDYFFDAVERFVDRRPPKYVWNR